MGNPTALRNSGGLLPERELSLCVEAQMQPDARARNHWRHFMTPFAKGAVALALAGAMTAGAMNTASARSWKPWAAAGAGFAAGAIVGSALAAPRYYGPGYYSAYAHSPGYTYAPAYESYAYEPGVVYESTVIVPRYYYGQDAGYRSCAVRGNYGGKTDYWAC